MGLAYSTSFAVRNCSNVFMHIEFLTPCFWQRFASLTRLEVEPVERRGSPTLTIQQFSKLWPEPHSSFLNLRMATTPKFSTSC